MRVASAHVARLAEDFIEEAVGGDVELVGGLVRTGVDLGLDDGDLVDADFVGAEGLQVMGVAGELETIGGPGRRWRGDGLHDGEVGDVLDVEAVADWIDAAHGCSLLRLNYCAADSRVGSWAIDGISMGA